MGTVSSSGRILSIGCSGVSSQRYMWPDHSDNTSGSRYFILLVDDANRFMWVKVLQSKDYAVEAIKKY
jgi:hypothetical protein